MLRDEKQPNKKEEVEKWKRNMGQLDGEMKKQVKTMEMLGNQDMDNIGGSGGHEG